MPFLAGLIVTLLGAAAAAATLLLFGIFELSFRLLTLFIGTMLGAMLAAPVTLIVLPLAAFATSGTRYDVWPTHFGVGLIAGGLWMLWFGYNKHHPDFMLGFVGAVCGAACGTAQWWLTGWLCGRPAAAAPPVPPAHS